jgi:uncharacterized sulfatase
LGWWLGLVSAGLASIDKVEAIQPPNFVWIIADDMSPDTGAYGLRRVHTPHLDRLASQGRRYDRAFATAPVCSSSRSAFILGCYQTTTGLHPHDVENPQPLAAPYEALPSLLRKAGWYVTNAAAPGAMRSGRAIKKGKTHYNFVHDPEVMFDGDDWRQRRPGQPFFAQFQITEPHRPFPVPENWDSAKLAEIDLPANYPDHPLMRRDWYAYERSVEVVDQRVGAILAQLEAEGVLDQTIVMFFADHGRPMPWGKQWLSIEGLRVPLIVRGPGVTPSSIEERLVSLVDLAPSILDLAGLPIPAWMQGQAVLSATFPTRSYIFAARDRCGDAYDRIRAVIGQDSLLVKNYYPELSRWNWSSYKEDSYPGMPLLRVLAQESRLTTLQTRWCAPTRSPLEFYDLQRDPQGLEDVSSLPDYQPRLVAMSQLLEQWVVASGDQGGDSDPATEPPLADIQREKREDFRRTWTKRLKQAEPTDQQRLQWWEQNYALLP